MNSAKTIATLGDLNNAVKAAANASVEDKAFLTACKAVAKLTAK